MSGYGIGQKPFTCHGIDLTRPVDRTVPNKFPVLENVTALLDGTITPRHGMGASAYATGPANKTPWHSMRTLNDPNAGSAVWSRISGVGDRLCDERSSAAGTVNNLDGAYSGNPLCLVQARPPESPQPWMYVGDSTRMRKVDRSGNVHSIGLPAPLAAPTVFVDQAFFRTIDLFEATTGWAAGGTAGAPTLLSAGPGRPINTGYVSTSSRTKDFSSAGQLLCVVPSSMANIIVGSVVILQEASLGAAFDVLVTETHSASATVAITHILYDSGTTGLCSVVLASSPPEIEVNSVLLLTGVATVGTEYVRVREVTEAPDGAKCLRISTASNRLATDTVAAKGSFSCNPFQLVSDTTTILSDGMRSAITATSSGTPATLSKVASLDLSSSIFGTFTRGANSDDYMSIEFRADRPDLITEIRVMLDCDANSVSAGAFTGTEFTRNYFVRAITASDIANLLRFTQTALANRQDQIQKHRIDNPFPSGGGSPSLNEGSFDTTTRFDTPFVRDSSDPPEAFNQPQLSFNDPSGSLVPSDPSQPIDPSRNQLGPGENQFFTVRWRLSEMQRIGSDDSRGFHDIVGLRVAFLTSGSVTVDLDSWIVLGGIEPEWDTLDEGYRYAYRGRVSSTGVASNLSPASQGAVRPLRQSVYVTLTQHPTTECDKLDIYRRGGNAAIPGWRYIATIDNAASPVFTDTISNEAALAVPAENGYDRVQPWSLPQNPIKGTATTVAGTLVKNSGTTFSTSWPPGMAFVANGVRTSIRRAISTSLVEVNDNCGGASSVAWEAPAPTLIAQPLPVLFEWTGDQRTIALGDPLNPSVFYVSRRRNYDATLETLRFEVPGAILMNGCDYNGTPYLWSTEHQYRVDHGGYDERGQLVLNVVRIPGSRGLAARWACCVGDRMYWLAKDGICVGSGGEPELLTDRDLYPLFPHAGLPGVAVNGFNPPTISAANEPATRLSWGDNRLWFDYVDSASARRSLEFRKREGVETSGWYPHAYAVGVVTHYFEEGPNKHALWLLGADTTTGKLYLATDATSDAGTAIAWRAQTQSENVGDPRKRKRWGDLSTEIDTDGGSVAVVIGFDKHTVTQTPSTSPVTGSGGTRQITIHDITDGVTVGGGREAVDVSLAVSGSVTTQRPKVYMWEPTWIDRPEVTARRAADFEDSGYAGLKFAQSLRLHFDAKGGTRSLVVQIDGNGASNVATITGITSAGYGPTWATFPFDPATTGTGPFVYRTFRVIPTDSANWQLFGAEIVFEPEPDAVTYYETQQTTHDIEEPWKVLRDALLVLRSSAAVTFSVLDATDRSVLYAVTVPSTGGFRKPVYLPLAAVKSKAFIYTLSSGTAFAVYVRDSHLRARGWGRDPAWHTVHPFGDVHRERGATT